MCESPPSSALKRDPAGSCLAAHVAESACRVHRHGQSQIQTRRYVATPEPQRPAVLVEVWRSKRIIIAARESEPLPVPEVVPSAVSAIAVPGDAVNSGPPAALYNSTNSRSAADEVSAAAPGLCPRRSDCRLCRRRARPWQHRRHRGCLKHLPQSCCRRHPFRCRLRKRRPRRAAPPPRPPPEAPAPSRPRRHPLRLRKRLPRRRPRRLRRPRLLHPRKRLPRRRLRPRLRPR